MHSYSFETQVHIVCTIMAIHNLIRRNSQTDVDFSQQEQGNISDENNNDVIDVAFSPNIPTLSSNQKNYVCDRIRDQLVRDI